MLVQDGIYDAFLAAFTDAASRLVVADDQDLATADLQLEERAVLAAPLLDLLVESRRLDLERVAEVRYAARPRQVFEAAQRAWRRWSAPRPSCSR